MKKKIIIGFVILIFIVFVKFESYSPLEQKILVGNMNHVFDVDFYNTQIDNDANDYIITFKKTCSYEKLRAVTNDLFDKCKKIVSKDKKYKKYNVKLVISAPSKKVLFVVTVNADGKIEKVYHTAGVDKALCVSTLSHDFSDTRQLIFETEDYKVLSNVDDYKEFTNLEYVSFGTSPGDEVIKYIKQKCPKCDIEIGFRSRMKGKRVN